MTLNKLMLCSKTLQCGYRGSKLLHSHVEDLLPVITNSGSSYCCNYFYIKVQADVDCIFPLINETTFGIYLSYLCVILNLVCWSKSFGFNKF